MECEFMADSNNEYIKMEKQIEKIFDNATNSNNVHEAVLFVENSKGDFSLGCGYGGRDIHAPLFTASVSKLFITTCILILQEQKKLTLDDNLGEYFNKADLEGLHNYKGKEYSYNLKISDLLFHTSGLPSWEEGDTIKHLIKSDFEMPFDHALDFAKKSHPHFPPSKKKSYYSDTNFILLGKIIEKITNLSLSQAYQDLIFTSLGMTNTYLPSDSSKLIPHVYYKSQSLHRPKFITSDSIVDAISTTADLMTFLKAFFSGTLFSKDIFEGLSTYRKLQMSMGPIFYGGGYMQIPMKSIYTFFMGKGELLGHSGSTGSFAFYFPEKDLYFVGDFNQMANPGLPIRLVMKLAMKLK